MRPCADVRPFIAIVLVLSSAACARPAGSSSSPAGNSAARLADAPDQFFEVDGFRIRYRDIGRGEPIVMLHGRGSNLSNWNWLGDSLARTHRVIAFDQRGAGLSTKSGDATRYGRSMANDVTGLLDQLRLRRAHVIAHSQGAVIAAFVAAHQPERVSTVTLIAGPFPVDSASSAANSAAGIRELESTGGMLSFYRQRVQNDSLARALNAEMMARNDAASLAATMKAIGGLAITAASPKIRAPLVVVVGTRDALVATNRRFASLTGAELIEIPEATHISVLQDAQVLATIRRQIAKRD